MKIVHGGDVWQGGAPGEYLDFSASLNPEGPPDWALAAMAEGLENAKYYPDAESKAARAGMAEYLGIPEECLLLTNGGTEAVSLAANAPFAAVAAQAGGRPGRHVIAQPAFGEYARACGTWEDVAWDAAVNYAFRPGDCLWMGNPNNPTGAARPRDEVLRMLARAESSGGRLVVDEAFIDYCPEHSARDQVQYRDALIVLGSLTKVLGIPGVRLGWLAAHPQVVARLREGLPPWRLNSLAEAVAAALPGHEAYFEEVRRKNDARREALAEALRGLGAWVYASRANFLMCDFGRDMRSVAEALRQEKILVRPCGAFPGLTDGHLRLAVRTEEENARLVAALRALL